MPHLFISYAKKDTRELALNLTDALNNLDGITAWVDRSLRAGKAWELQIQAEIDRCDTMIVLYSPDINRHRSGKRESYVLTEIAYAMWTANKPIIPVMAQQTDPPISLTMHQYIDFTISGLSLDDLVEAICDELDISVQNVASTPQSAQPRTQHTDPTPAAIERARNFTGTRNSDWTPYVTIFPDLKIPDMTFCLVPVGSFQMGSKNHDDEKPIHLQTITQPYWIAQFPVTNAQWKCAVDAGAVKELHGSSTWKWYQDPAMAQAPIVGIDWFMAHDYAAWLGCRLPTEREWEYAARGVESLVYPWGNDWKPDNTVWDENSDGKPAPVNIRPGGKSWVAAWHLSGNVWEWTNSLYEPYPYHDTDGRQRDTGESTSVRRVLRGGSWGFVSTDSLRSNYRYCKFPNLRYDDRGFRLVRSIP